QVLVSNEKARPIFRSLVGAAVLWPAEISGPSYSGEDVCRSQASNIDRSNPIAAGQGLRREPRSGPPKIPAWQFPSRGMSVSKHQPVQSYCSRLRRLLELLRD